MKKIFSTYFKNFHRFFIILIVPILLYHLIFTDFFLFSSKVIPMSLGLLMFILFLFLNSWAVISIIKIIESSYREIDFKFLEIIKIPPKKILGFTALCFLNYFILIGAAVPLVIPFVIVGIFIIFSQFIYILENKSLIESFAASHMIVKGKWLRTFLKVIIPVGLLALILKSPFFDSYFIKDNEIILNAVLSIILSPFVLLYLYYIYTSLKRQKVISQIKPNLKLYKYLASWGFVVIISFFGYFIFNLEDIQDNFSDELKLTKESFVVPDHQNAFYSIDKFNRTKIQYPDRLTKDLLEKMLDSGDIDERLINEFFNNNPDILKIVNEIAQYDFLQYPGIDSPSKINYESPVLFIGDFQKLTMILSLKAIIEAKSNNFETALDLIKKNFKIAYLFRDGSYPPSILQDSIGQTQTDITIKALARIVNSFDFPSDKAIDLIKYINQYKTSRNSLIEALKIDYWSLANTLDKVKQDTFNIGNTSTTHFPKLFKLSGLSQYYFKPNKTKKFFADNLIKEILAVKNCFSNESGAKDLPRLSPFLIFKENGFGEIFKSLFFIVRDPKSIQRSCLIDFKLGAIEILLSLKAYQNKFNALPDALNELTPNITAIPTDPFSPNNESLKYSKNKKIIYSIGIDRIDVGGGKNYDDINEPTLKIEF